MAVLVDTNVLVDIAVRDPVWLSWSRSMLARVGNSEPLTINPIIYAEFSVRYDDIDAVDYLLPEREFRRESLPWAAAFAAGAAFRVYRNGGGARDRVPPDFLIGAHAAIRGYAILTRDPKGYRLYFPDVPLITPETHPLNS
ncbi:type II toxin-antitoxin system VapC family toxin [Neorhizobium sp. T786]|uniref:type II toxin-antitoxin system VapC family toxin n=1 Tax=Pseudorhizobium xiangyangii TaxID=2883104 RepID=UPI001CFFE112|nr:type II toxin-antitoxin system VapC family toxin [Neorhizobium xiangyangii]MCB5203922.1 type II toxin-antitoxin system VapC family toxin [Neorhizobium xiangyangii]